MIKTNNRTRKKVSRSTNSKRSRASTRRAARRPVTRTLLNKLQRLQRKHVVASLTITAVVGLSISGAILLNNSKHVEAKLPEIRCSDKKTGKGIYPDKKVYYRNGPTGYFMYPGSGCPNRDQMERAHKMGADTVVTFGPTLAETNESQLTKDAEFSKFVVNGKSGIQYVRQVTGEKINRIFTYKFNQTFSTDALGCGQKRNGMYINADDNVYTWWLLPVDGAYSDCHSPTGTYDLVIAYSRTRVDYNTIMVTNAETFGMKAYLGLPMPGPDKKITYVADVSYMHTLLSFTTRLLATWDQRFGTSPGFGGVYQSREMAVFGSRDAWKNTLDLYSAQNQIVQYQLKKDKENVIVSPYASLDQQPLSRVAPSYKEIVDTRKGMAEISYSSVELILAPQDGVGTGKVGLDRVDSYLREAKKAGADQFWVNIELFKPGGKPGNRPLTDKATLEKQVAIAKKHGSKVIAFDWSYAEKAGIVREILGKNY